MSTMPGIQALGMRGIRESLRTPDALLPTLFIPLFFLFVNIGQASRIFPAGDTAFLFGQGYGAFQLPASLLLAGSFGSAALYLVEEIEGGYFDKLRATPAARSSIVFGRLVAEAIKSVVLSTVMILIAMLFDVHIESGILGYLVLVVMVALWAVAFSGFMQLIALKSRSAAATQAGSMVFFPLLFLTPNFVPRESAGPADGDRRHAQSGHLRDGGGPLAHPRGLRRRRAGQGLPGRGRRAGADGGAQRADDQPLRLTTR